MDQLSLTINSMIGTSKEELEVFVGYCKQELIEKKTTISVPNVIPNQIFFIEKGLIRVYITDTKGTNHSIHFALENQFIADYSAFLRKSPAIYTLETLEQTQLVRIPREAIEWGYQHLPEGEKLGRLIAEFYFIYQDNRINNLYSRTPKERYDLISEVFPNIHNRVPQHMIASYLGITSVHLSRLKKADKLKT